MLKPNALKAEQINAINRQETIVGFLVDMAFGDESALDRMQKFMDEVVNASPAAITIEAQAPVLPPAAIPTPPASNVLPFPPGAPVTCQCPMSVKDQHSATQLCLLCGKNAYANHYVFAHTDEGKRLLDQTRDLSGVINATAADIIAHGTYISADGIVFLPTTETELHCDGEESE